MEDGGLVTHPTQVLLGQIQAQTLLVAGTVVGFDGGGSSDDW